MKRILTKWLLRNPEVHYRPYISPPLVPIFSKSYPVTRITTRLPQVHFNIILPSTSWLPFLQVLALKTLYAFLDSSIRDTCPAHFSRLDLKFLIMLGEEYSACSSALCSFLHSPIISILLAPNIFLSTFFYNTLNLWSFLKVRYQDSQPHNTIGNIIVLYVLTFSFLESRH